MDYHSIDFCHSNVKWEVPQIVYYNLKSSVHIILRQDTDRKNWQMLTTITRTGV